MPTILLTNKYSNKILSVVRKELPEGFEFISLEKLTKKELMIKAADADYFLASGRLYIDKKIIESAPKLKMVQRTGVGIDTLDLTTLKGKEIPVYINNGINSTSVAEHTILLMLSVLRQLTIVDSGVKSGKWNKNDMGFECRSLNNKTVGIIGIGNIGKKVVKMLKPFNVKILYYNPNKLPPNVEEELDIEYCDLRSLITQVDILSLHCPLTSETKGIIGSFELSRMKKSSIIINTARGELIDENALTEALISGKILGAGLDVFTKEPPISDDQLFKLSNVILTPHIGGLSLETFTAMICNAFKNIRLFELGRFDLIDNNRLK